MYERVLHPTDGSENAEVATKHAIEIARRFDAPLHALYVVDVSAVQSTDAFATSNFEATVEALETEGTERIEAVRERAEREGVEVTDEMVQGKPAETITEAADPDDVVVMGTHGRSGIDRYLIGSTTKKVVRTAEVPVVTIPMTELGESEE
ncbi:universal stress protein [Natronoarchaeum mannanilyticum]|uniref:Universal stress protein n=1 Tax=Natronoarchaeum mannanilyticum TaxID=926360 RepID=A0AAV3T4P6_9EURY